MGLEEIRLRINNYDNLAFKPYNSDKGKILKPK